MKISRAVANSKKKEFVLQVGKNKLIFPFAKLKVRPSPSNPVVSVFLDSEVGHNAITYELKNGRQDTILLDQVLDYNKDPEYLRQATLYKLTLEAQKLLASLKISKRTLARHLNTSPAQVYRLLDQTFHGKTIDQMLKLLFVLGCDLDVVIRKRVA
jgi:Cro/C1-type HTH DNA-binding domain